LVSSSSPVSSVGEIAHRIAPGLMTEKITIAAHATCVFPERRPPIKSTDHARR
jgi:hypothetical protein